MNGSGARKMWGWPESEGNGWLVRDLNNNGTIDDGRELFGNATLLAGGQLAKNGFVALQELDSNQDGTVDQEDPGFAQLRVWRDTARDGLSDSSELTSLQELGVSGISTNVQVTNRRDRWRNLFRWRSTLFLHNGKSRHVYDVILSPGGSNAGAACGASLSSEIKLRPPVTEAVAGAR